jgi:hypothetical protein
VAGGPRRGEGRGAAEKARPKRLSETGGSTPVPDAWIGRAVELIFVSGSSMEYTDGYLEEVNDRVIVLTRWRATASTRRGLCSSRGEPSSKSPRRRTDEGGC